MNGNDVIEEVISHRVIPVLVIDELEITLPLASALAAGGLPVAEVTFRTEAAVDAIRLLSSETAVLVGAGSVIMPTQVDLAVDAGARYIVTPGFSPQVVDRCKELEVPVIPGVATATEVIAALERGLDLLKFFPAEASGGVSVLRALQGPFPSVRWVPTGGVNADNAAAYFEMTSVVALGGSWMVAPNLIAARDFAAISRLTSEAVHLGTKMNT